MFESGNYYDSIKNMCRFFGIEFKASWIPHLDEYQSTKDRVNELEMQVGKMKESEDAQLRNLKNELEKSKILNQKHEDMVSSNVALENG